MADNHLYTNSHGPDKAAVDKALNWLVSQSGSKGFIAFYAKDNLKNGVVAPFLGTPVVKALLSSGQATFKGITLELVTEKKMIYDGESCPMVAFHVSLRVLKKLEGISNVSSLLAVPWIEGELAPWISENSATAV